MHFPKAGSRAVIAAVAATFAAFVADSVAARATPQDPQIRLDSTSFDWIDAIEDMASFEWSVNVVNNSNAARRLRVILDLLDDDDRPVNRDERGNPNDAVIITVAPNETLEVKQQGALNYDRAAEIVQFRARFEIINGEEFSRRPAPADRRN